MSDLSIQEDNIKNESKINLTKKTVKKRTFKDNKRKLAYDLSSIRADFKFVRRMIFRELRYFIPILDLTILFTMIALIIIVFLIFAVLGVPFVLFVVTNENQTKLSGEIFRLFINDTTIRYGAGVIGISTFIIRTMIKSPIAKYRDKVNARKDVTYIFGSSKFAEKFLFEMIFQYGYEERVSLIADADYLWIRKLKSLIDTYVVEDIKEFEKPNLYEIIEFKNASRVMILTESIELSQNILTNIRQVRPDVEIIIPSQFTPAFLFSDLVNDKNLKIIDDLETTIQGLVLSLNLDIHQPQSAEIDVPKTFLGWSGDDMTSDVPSVEVVAVKRNGEILDSSAILQPGDRVVVFYIGNYFMKMANRLVTEFPYKKKSKKKKKEKDKEEKEIVEVDTSIESEAVVHVEHAPAENKEWSKEE